MTSPRLPTTKRVSTKDIVSPRSYSNPSKATNSEQNN